MTSFIIAAKDPIVQKQELDNLLAAKDISAFDVTRVSSEKQIGIEEIRELRKKLSLRPIQGAWKATVVTIVQGITPQAQNALLKMLEEPPEHTIIILTTSSETLLLPTILSRCTLIKPKAHTQLFSEKKKNDYLSILEVLQTGNIGARLRLAQDVAKVETAKKLEELTMLLHQQVFENEKTLPALATLIRKLQKTYTILQTTNANPRLTLEATFLSL